MNVVNSSLPLLSVLIPVIGAIIINRISEHHVKTRNLTALITVTTTFLIIARMLPMILQGFVLEYSLVHLVAGLELAFKVDQLGIIFGFTSSLLWILSIIYSMGYMSQEAGQRRYFCFYVLSMSATMGVAFSANLFTMYIFFEYLTLCTYPLVVHPQTEEATRSGIKYIVYCFGGGALILFSLLILQGMVQSVNFVPGGIPAIAQGEPHTLLFIIFFLAILGFGTKGALMPLHSWLPSAMVAPTPVSALLHAVAVVKSGVFGMIRVLYFIFGPATLIKLGVLNYLAVIVCFTILAGSIMALRQNVLKLRLAYSTVSQLAYITLGGLMLTPAGLTGGIVHIMNHAVLKITLFFCAGAIIKVTGKTQIDELKGVGRRMPMTMIAFAIGGLGLIGILPIAGYISKYYLLSGALDSGRIVFIFVILASSLLNAMYYLPIVVNAFFREGEFTRSNGPEAPLTMLIPLILLATAGIFLGLFANKTTIPLVENVVRTIF
jgi:multicomponent Na+:H+ antiporter subunit D